MFDTILHAKWVKGNSDNEIIHYWAEDMSTDIITVPYQIRDEIVEMQNWLTDKYEAVCSLKTELSLAERFFK